MANPIFRILTHPQLERYRARIPYPLVVGTITFVVFGFVSLLIVLLQIAKAKTGMEVAPDISPLTPLLFAALYPVLLTLAAIAGFVSGYRPFIHRWDNVRLVEMKAIGARLAAAAENAGFQIVWRGAQGAFVGVLNMALEHQHINDGEHFPMRLSFFVHTAGTAHGNAIMKLQNRTVVFWDSGERSRCRSIGEALLRGDAAIAGTRMPAEPADERRRKTLHPVGDESVG